jgi:glyoxylase-like metal-dependent hydrolase (beta-lactamase superfamily II)
MSTEEASRPHLCQPGGATSATAVVECLMLDTGYCLASEHHIMRGGRRRTVHCHSLVALLRHPGQGWLLWDTGYAPRMLTATQRLPFSLYARITPLRLRPELAVSSQLMRLGMRPADIERVILSHFHADHVAGLRDFPSAQPIALAGAYAHVAGRTGLAALSAGYIPSLIPTDFERRALLLDRIEGPSLGALGQAHDLFGDGSLLLVPLPGHARGQMGLLANTSSGRVLFAADSCWLSQAVRQQRPPAGIARFIADSSSAVSDTLARLKRFLEANPDVRLVPSHCPEAFAREVVGKAPLWS